MKEKQKQKMRSEKPKFLTLWDSSLLPTWAGARLAKLRIALRVP